MSRVARLVGTGGLAIWFALPFVPLVLWAFADAWSFPSKLPTAWGVNGVDSALAQDGVAAFARSVALATSVAMIAVPLGAMAARALTFGSVPFARVVGALLLAPIALPPFAAVLGVNVVLLRAYVPPVPGLILVLVVLALPYTTFVMRVAYAAHDLGYEEEGRLLGASRAAVFWRVHVPLLAPALARAAFLGFLVGWSDYIVTVVVGGGELVTLPLVVASAAAGVGNDSVVAVLSLAAIVPPLVVLVASETLARRRKRVLRRTRRTGIPPRTSALSRASKGTP